MCPATPNVTAPRHSGPAGNYNSQHVPRQQDYNSRRARGGTTTTSGVPAEARVQLPACPRRQDYNSRRALWRRNYTSPVWREPRALSPGPAGPAERGSQPAPPPAAAGPAQEVGASSPLPFPSRAVSPPRRRSRPLTRRPLLYQGLGRRPAERHGRIPDTGESCPGLPRSPSRSRSQGLSPARWTVFSFEGEGAGSRG